MLSAWRLCSTAMDVIFERRPRVTIQIWLKLRPALPYPNRSSCLGLSEGLLRAKLSPLGGLSNDRSRSFSDDSILAKRREIHQQGKFIEGSVYYFDFAECSLCWCAGYWQAAEDGVKHCQIRKARQWSRNRYGYVLLSHCFTKVFCCDLLACLHDLRRRHCHHHPLVLYTEDRHILPLYR